MFLALLDKISQKMISLKEPLLLFPHLSMPLQEKYSQPRLLFQSEIGAILNSSIVRIADIKPLDDFSVSVHALVGMSLSLEGPNGSE